VPFAATVLTAALTALSVYRGRAILTLSVGGPDSREEGGASTPRGNLREPSTCRAIPVAIC
jgi:hypothetical protein